MPSLTRGGYSFNRFCRKSIKTMSIVIERSVLDFGDETITAPEIKTDFRDRANRFFNPYGPIGTSNSNVRSRLISRRPAGLRRKYIIKTIRPLKRYFARRRYSLGHAILAKTYDGTSNTFFIGPVPGAIVRANRHGHERGPSGHRRSRQNDDNICI